MASLERKFSVLLRDGILGRLSAGRSKCVGMLSTVVLKIVRN